MPQNLSAHRACAHSATIVAANERAITTTGLRDARYPLSTCVMLRLSYGVPKSRVSTDAKKKLTIRDVSDDDVVSRYALFHVHFPLLLLREVDCQAVEKSLEYWLTISVCPQCPLSRTHIDDQSRAVRTVGEVEVNGEVGVAVVDEDARAIP